MKKREQRNYIIASAMFVPATFCDTHFNLCFLFFSCSLFWLFLVPCQAKGGQGAKGLHCLPVWRPLTPMSKDH
jgi:hypothetical protein